VVEERGAGELGTVLDGELRYPADLLWDWSTATELDHHRLPGEPPLAPIA
jgi:hypothetical protein